MKSNCWEMLNCGRGPGGNWVNELGLCPVAASVECDGLNGGTNGGRICWAIAGTYCGGKIQGTFSDKCISCSKCAVFQRVQEEEGESFRIKIPADTENRAERPSASTHERIIADTQED